MRRFATHRPRRLATAHRCLLSPLRLSTLLGLLVLACVLRFGVFSAQAQNLAQVQGLAQAPAQVNAPATASPSTSANTPAPGPAGVQIALEGAGLADFLRFMGQFLGQPPVFREDQIPQAKVTILARRTLAPTELRELFDLVLQAAGLQAARRGEVLYVLPASTAAAAFGPKTATAPSVFGARRPPGPLLPPEAHILVRVLSARVAPGTVDSLVEVFDGLRTDQGQALGSHGVRAVLVADGQARVAQLSPVLEAVATAADSLALGGASTMAGQNGLRAEVVPLRRTSPRLALKKIEMQLRGQPGPVPPAMPLVVSLDWSNSLLLAGDAQGLAQARRLVAQLDDAGREAPALRAFRTRHIRPEKLAEAITTLLGAGALPEAAALPEAVAGGQAQGFGQVRVRVDAEAGAVLVLAYPEVMARLERLAEDLDQPRPRVYIEALVAELPPELERELSVLPLPPVPPVPAVPPVPMGAQASAPVRGQAPGAVVISAPVVANPAGQGRPFALAEVGGAAVFRGRAAEAPQYGLDSLAALIGADGRGRVLAQPRVAVPDGGEARVSDGPGAQVQAGRLRMTLAPRVERGTGRVEVTVSVEDAQYPGQVQSATALLGEGQVLLLLGGGALPAQSARPDSGWTLFSPGASRGKGPARLGIVLSARVVRPARPGPPPAPASPATVAPARGASANP